MRHLLLADDLESATMRSLTHLRSLAVASSRRVGVSELLCVTLLMLIERSLAQWRVASGFLAEYHWRR